MNTLRQAARTRLRGALLGLTTPFTPAGAFDEEAFLRNVEFCIESGFRALVVAGTYGEVTALTQDERRQVIRAAAQQARGRAAILADTHHVGSLDEVIALTRHAAEAGTDCAYILTPYYFRPTARVWSISIAVSPARRACRSSSTRTAGAPTCA